MRTLWILRDAVLITVLVLAVTGAFFYGVLGYRVNVINGHSMEPTREDGSIVITKPTDSAEVGDIIKFRYNGIPTIHRVVGKSSSGYETKGDNTTLFPEAQTIADGDLMGVEVYHLPAVGGLWPWLMDNALYLVIIGGLLLGLNFLLRTEDIRSLGKKIKNLRPMRAGG